MAITPPIGSSEDIYNRLIDQLPSTWFGSDAEGVSVISALNTVLAGYINTTVYNYQQYDYVQLQQRIQTATEDNLDLISLDYYGGTLPRRPSESDNSYRNRILASLLQEKATRPGIQNALTNLTGYVPRMFEPWYSADCGGYNDFTSLAYDTVGNYGSGSYPYDGFIDVYVSQYTGMGNYNGYNNYFGGYNAAGSPAEMWYGGESLNYSIISDQDIYNEINRDKVEGTICWVAIHRIAQAPS